MKAVKQISTGRLVYRQDPDFEAGKGILCAKAMGFPEADLEEIEITQADWDTEIAQRPETLRAQAMLTNLPNWAQVNTSIDNISNLAEAKAFMKKLARVVYWLAKEKAE